jgi:hypothetical protein
MSTIALAGRAWEMVRRHRFLIVLGALPSAAFWILQAINLTSGGIIGTLLGFIIGVLTQGALVAGVGHITTGERSNFWRAMGTAWDRKWALFGLNLFIIVPVIGLGVIFGLGLALTWMPTLTLISQYADPELIRATAATSFGVSILLLFILLLCTIPLTLMQNFTDDACLLENLGMLASYRRAATIVRDHFGAAVGLSLLQLILALTADVVLFLPNVLLTLCPLAWPLQWFLNGMVAAFSNTLYTLVWQQWTGKPAPATRFHL